MRFLTSLTYVVVLLIGQTTSFCEATLITNAPMPITHLLKINPIIVRDNAGNNPATFMGTVAQETSIKGLVDTIWAQAGIDVMWLAPMSLNSTETLNGSEGPNGNNPRPQSDLTSDPGGIDHETIGENAGVRVANTINMFFVDIAAGFGPLGLNFVAGLAEVPGNDISLYVGSDLLNFLGGQELVASVISHEIGHNLSLPHLEVTEGLLRSGLMDPPVPGERLNSAQIGAALSSGINAGLLVAVPEPSAFLFVGSIALIGMVVTKVRRRPNSTSC